MLSIWLLCYGNILLQFICRMFLPPPLGYLFGVSSKQVFKTHLETRSGVDSVWSAKNEMNGMRYNYTNTHSHTMLYVVDPHSTKKVMTLRKSNRAHKLNKSWNYNVKICINCSIHLLSLPLCQILCRTPFSQFCWNFIKFVQFSLFLSLSVSLSTKVNFFFKQMDPNWGWEWEWFFSVPHKITHAPIPNVTSRVQKLKVRSNFPCRLLHTIQHSTHNTIERSF